MIRPVTEGDALLKAVTINRSWRIPQYTGLVMSGTFLLIEPSTLVVEQVTRFVAVAWAVGMIFSACVCLYGAFTDKWIGEYAGLPLLASVIAFYGVSAIVSTQPGGGLVRIAFGIVLLSFASGLVARWRDVRSVRKFAMIVGSKDYKGE